MLKTNIQLSMTVLFVTIYCNGSTRRLVKLRFDIIIKSLDSSSDKWSSFVTMTHKTIDKYQKPIWKLKQGDTWTRKCECPLRCRSTLRRMIHGYLMWFMGYITMNCVTSFHSIACHLNYEEKDIVFDMTLNMVQPKNILT